VFVDGDDNNTYPQEENLISNKKLSKDERNRNLKMQRATGDTSSNNQTEDKNNTVSQNKLNKDIIFGDDDSVF
jgi:hypothetical protein